MFDAQPSRISAGLVAESSNRLFHPPHHSDAPAESRHWSAIQVELQSNPHVTLLGNGWPPHSPLIRSRLSLSSLEPVYHSAGLSLHPSALGHAARAIICTRRVLQHEGPLQLFPLPFLVSSIPISSSMGQTPTEKMATPPRVMKKFLRLSPKALISKRGIQLCQRGGTVGQQERQREEG